jgi:hypothetical protein
MIVQKGKKVHANELRGCIPRLFLRSDCLEPGRRSPGRVEVGDHTGGAGHGLHCTCIRHTWHITLQALPAGEALMTMVGNSIL